MITIHGQLVPSTCGIYSITNTTNGRVYIGSTTDLSVRWSGHKSALRNNRHPNQQLQEDWNRHGEAAFVFAMVEADSSGNIEELRRRERDWIRHHEHHMYNVWLSMLPSEYQNETGAAKTKERFEQLQRAAQQILLDHRVDVSSKVEIWPLAKIMARQERCFPTTAKKHIARAIRQARGEVDTTQWGGPRLGSGQSKR